MQSRFLLSLSAGVGAPDVSQLQLAEAARYSRTRRLTDLTPVARKYEKDFPASFWKNCVFEGRVYAIPWDMGPCAVFYKRSLFARYQIDPESIATWDDYIAAGKTLLERSGGKTKMLSLSTGNMEGLFEILLQQNAGQIFDDEGRIAVNSPQAMRVMSVIHRILEAGINANITPYSHAAYASMKSDLVATYPTAAWFGGTIKDYAPDTRGDWGVFRLPAMEPGGLRTSNLGGSVLVIPDQCKQKAAAWAFIEYALCTREGQIEQYRNFDLFPGLLPTHADPFFDEPDPFYGGQKVRRLFALDIEKIPPLNRTKDWFEALRYLTQSLSKWTADGMGPPEQFLAQLEQKLSRRLGREVAHLEASNGS
jgi:ABC-type glycerol-3-phosphate transport system substrate-binding protein